MSENSIIIQTVSTRTIDTGLGSLVSDIFLEPATGGGFAVDLEPLIAVEAPPQDQNEKVSCVIANSSICQTDWNLVGMGEKYLDCGVFGWKGCLDVGKHGVNRLDVGLKYAGKVYVKGFRRSCDRAECPICMPNWVRREVRRALYRLKHYRPNSHRKAIHVSVSVARKDYSLSYTCMRKRAYKMLSRVGIEGGVIIFHPFRKNKTTHEWYYSPHFHVIGYGWVLGTGENYRETGWFVKNHQDAKSRNIPATLGYQLNHSGKHEGVNAVTWFGALSYGKLHVPKEVLDAEVCPLCCSPLEMLRYVGSRSAPGEGEFFLNKSDWESKRGNGYGC